MAAFERWRSSILSHISFQQPTVVGLITIWLTLVGTGFGLLLAHDFSARASAAVRPDVDWAVLADDSLQQMVQDQDWTMAIAVHPHCPCTQATLQELGRQLQNARSTVQSIVLMYCPSSQAAHWTNGRNWETVSQLPHVTIVIDRDGLISHRLGLRTSGEIVVAGRNGDVRFQGGITASRSCAGNCPGQAALQELLSGRQTEFVMTPVFGCAIEE